MTRCVIIGGAAIHNYEVIRTYLRPDDFIVCCDSGLKHRSGLGVEADLIIADLDSAENPHLPVETIVLPHEKDDTDSMAAVREMTARGYDEFLLLGVFGDRLDHTLGNIYVLLWLTNRGKKALAVDDYSEMEIISPGVVGKIDCAYPYFSLVSIAGAAGGVTIKNAKYTLNNAIIDSEYQYAVSNEPIPGKTAEVSLKKGALLLIRDRSDKN
ncbi:MAG: thiamine diphosphokinase [Anaerolineaceae bacterium]|nr:thiamine diphosphokinase [Anaerolineaceae bacterium]